jgi:four helix bundle protein
MQNFRNLLVWQKAHELALLTYQLTANFPREETFGLRNSLRKVSTDIPAYIAEGCGKLTDADFARTMGVALGLANRLEYYALLARDLMMMAVPQHADYEQLIIEVKKMISGFNRRLQP